MNTLKLTGLMLAFLSGTATAQVGELTNAEVTEMTSITDPASAVQAAGDRWFAFSMQVIGGTRSPCCWKGQRNGYQETGCSLEPRHESYGTHSDSPLTDKVIAYARIEAGEVHAMRVVGEQCPVDGGGAKVVWIGDTDAGASLSWLESVARSDDHSQAVGSALHAMALHASDEASRHLYAMASEPAGELAEEAIFWLGESRGTEGFNTLKRLLNELPDGDARREINFALAQNGSRDAVELLSRISRTDRDPGQRGSALFWLADEFPDLAPELLLEAIASEQDERVLEQAVFAISQLPDDRSGRMLLELARDEQKPREVRRQALFWLADSGDEEAIAALVELLTSQY